MKDQYATMVRANHLKASDLTRLRNETSTFRYRPLVSVLIPVSDPEQKWLERALDSLISQVYPNWELFVCGDGSTEEHTKKILSRYERLDERVKVSYLDQDAGPARLFNETLALATGEFVTLLGGSDELAPDALFQVIKVLQEHPECDLIYSDSDKIDEKGVRIDPHFKPGWSPDLLLSTNYVSHLSVYRKSLVEEVGGFRKSFESCQDYDLVLRVTERTGAIHHIPKVLYHRRTFSDSSTPVEGDQGSVRDENRRALSEALERRGLEGSVEDSLLPDHFQVKRKIEGEPKISLLIPTRNNVSLLKNCVESVERLTTYRNYEILIVDNDSDDPATVEYLASSPHRVIRFREEFNYSRINNFAVAQAEGEYVLLLNDDTEVISGGWLEAMLEHAQRPEVGAVGARLLYPDGRIQHAGVLVGLGNRWGPGVAVHSHQFYPSDSPGYAGTAMTTINYSAVTAACMLLRKSLFNELGGMDEKNLRVSFNDVDLCLRIREQGYLIVYTPYAELYHHESVSRGYGGGDPAEMLYMRNRWGEVLDKDPYYNANFSTGSADYNIRADLLRPQVLRPTVGQTQEESGSSFMSLLTTSREEFQSYIKAQQMSARSSSRTAIVPVSGDRTARTFASGNVEHEKGLALQENGQLEEELPTQANREVEGRKSRRALRTEQLIWIFGSPRTGSTWLSRMMAELGNQERWHEPYIGLLFGSFLYERLEANEKLLNNPSFIMGEPYRNIWLNSIKDFLLQGAAVRYPKLRRDQYLVVKEPNGSIGAPLLIEATPDSHMIFLIRDPRDVVASRLDAFKEGAWSAQNRDYSSAEKLNAFTRHLAEEYFSVVSQVERAYKAHQGNKALVRYEDLRRSTLGTLKDMYAVLGIQVSGVELEAAVKKHSWEQIPESDKGSGKFYRKAQPGGWREDLLPTQIEIIEEITKPVLSKYYQTTVSQPKP